MTAKRGLCDVCAHRHLLRADGTLQAHNRRPVKGYPAVRCKGSGQPPRPLRFGRDGMPDCGECAGYLFAKGTLLIEACASVGIEHGKSTGQMMRLYIEGYHDRAHVEVE